VGQHGLAGDCGWEGILGHEHVRDQLVPELSQSLQGKKNQTCAGSAVSRTFPVPARKKYQTCAGSAVSRTFPVPARKKNQTCA